MRKWIKTWLRGLAQDAPESTIVTQPTLDPASIALERRVAILEQERGLRESELIDLRTRYVAVIRRIEARQDATAEPDGDLNSVLALRRSRGV